MSHKADEHGVLPVAGGTADYSSPEVYALLTRQPVPEGGSRVEPCLLSDLPPIGYVLLDCAGLRGVPYGLHKFAREGGALPEGYPAAFVDFVLWLTAQDPAKRGSAQELLGHRWLQQQAGGVWQ
ncbi:hypothetical protein HYH02_010509 [Chlamydomonas schloesseri]|uniref:Protein kinase domain-containing protein n=1 Tax=Chlamydomonas schloesseri TaxID=2026947 RepID=A0A835TGG5_9CHLO|nr:hypothetical protein HYH02_010509 [Chlamydomonas schloesseri]|eukprot:KAG2439879.1 hypothetical protein HYH02_010509 [Chlamydomonas schloesseri]